MADGSTAARRRLRRLTARRRRRGADYRRWRPTRARKGDHRQGLVPWSTQARAGRPLGWSAVAARRGTRAAPLPGRRARPCARRTAHQARLDGDQLAERLQRGGEAAPPASGSQATDSRIASVLTRKGSITPAGADPGQPARPQATWRPLEPRWRLAAQGLPAVHPAGHGSQASTCRYQPCTTRRSPGPLPSSRQPRPAGTAPLRLDDRARSRWQGCDADGSPGPRRWRATGPAWSAEPPRPTIHLPRH
jgi:hypothetical protein